MRRKFSGLLAIVIVALALLPLTACQSQATTSPSTTDPRFSPPLTLEQAQQQLKQTGSTVVDTVEKASKIAGFPIALPRFVPKNFFPYILTNSSSFNISGTILSIASGNSSGFLFVIQQYSLNQRPPGDKTPSFMLQQTRNKGQELGDGLVPIDIGGHAGTKKILSGDNKNYSRLSLSWNDGITYYNLLGTLAAPLDEATLIKIAASMRVP